MEPASSIIADLGGPSAVAGELGVHRVTVHKWTWSRERRGTDGVIPWRYIGPLREFAQRLGVSLPADRFLPIAAGSQPAASSSLASPPVC